MRKKLILLFDGTWNNKRDRTNVTHMKESIISSGEDDPEQACFYDAGVGTRWYDRWTGGAFGRGLSENIREGYMRLVNAYKSGDEIYVFGFSRGAYTARSLVGLIRKCGLLTEDNNALIEKAYDLYREKDIAPEHPKAIEFRTKYSREIRIKFIGVWDTVGALGIPVSHVPFNSDYYRFHDTELSKIVDYAYHAVAVDENRKDFNVALWNKIKPENIEVEQRWFIGAHSDIGGGKMPENSLSHIPLRWMQEKAEASGLKLNPKVVVGDSDYLSIISDSYAEFMFGVYRLFKDRYTRKFGVGVNETVDISVWKRFRTVDYRPLTLARHPDTPELA
ncbi:MAG: DUF2235 domain-containing protein [Nitrosomonas sp.]|nr:DUF2235 domain-containing protein [Nitrosomonas sp.]